MALKTFVKVGNVTNLSDARYCAGMGVDVIGFSLTPGTKNFVPADKFSEITEWLSGVDFAGEFEGLSASEIDELTGVYNVQYIQISDPSLIKELSGRDIPLIFKVDIEKGYHREEILPLLQQHHHQVSLFLFESEQDSFDPAILEEILVLSREYPVLLGYGVEPSTLSKITGETALKGISLLGEEEIRAGYKDFDKLAEVLELLEVDEFED